MRDVSKRWLCIAALAVIAGGVGWFSQSERGESTPRHLAVRRTTVRLSVPIEHRPCRWKAIAGRSLPTASCGELGGSRRDVVAASREWLASGPATTSSDHRTGVALLIAGHPAAAVARLEDAVRGDQSPETLADLAAARIELAIATDDPYGLVAALDDLERVARSSQPSVAVSYNRALVLGLLNLRGPAREAWRGVGEREDEEAWRNDAEAWLDRLGRPTDAERWGRGQSEFFEWIREGVGDELSALDLARRHPQHARILAEEEGFEAWAVAAESGGQEAAAAIAARLVRLGRELFAVTGDELLLQAAEAIVACEGEVCRALADGHRRYAHARRLHEKQQYEPAGPLFQASCEELSRAGTPFAVWPAFYQAVIVAHRPDFSLGTQELRALFDHPGATQPIAKAYLHWMLGWIARRQSERGEARSEFSTARDLFRASWQRENEGEMESQLGSVWDELGEPRRAWRHHFRALSLLDSSFKPRRIENTLSGAATGLRKRGEFAASLVFQDLSVEQARSRENPLAVAVALRYKAQSHSGLGEELEALRAVQEGLQQAERIPDERLRADPRVNLLLTWGTVARTDLAAALERVEEALRFAERHRLRTLLPEGHATAAALRRELGDLVGESRALNAAVKEIERQRTALTPEARVGFAASARKVMEQGALSMTERGSWAEAFAFVDRLRARALWDAMAPGDAETRELRRESLAPNEAVLSYLVLPDRVLVWWVRHDKIEGFEVAVGRESLEELVLRLHRAVRTDDAVALRRLRRRLSELLLAEIRPQLDGLRRLIVIPDGPLGELPFAALEGHDGDWLAGGPVSVTTLPAAALYPMLKSRAQRSISFDRWLLVVAPAHSTSDFRSLGRLTAGVPLIERWRERLGGDLRVLTAEEATPAAFLRAAPSADVVIFLGHALAPSELSGRSGLVLAPDGESDGLLELDDVRFEGRAAPRLAVLAGCGTGRGRATATEGSVTVGWSFLRSGVPEVVATLWEVDAAGAATMTELLLAAVAAGQEDPLRDAQRQAILSGAVPPSVWMAFQSIGVGG